MNNEFEQSAKMVNNTGAKSPQGCRPTIPNFKSSGLILKHSLSFCKRAIVMETTI